MPCSSAGGAVLQAHAPERRIGADRRGPGSTGSGRHGTGPSQKPGAQPHLPPCAQQDGPLLLPLQSSLEPQVSWAVWQVKKFPVQLELSTQSPTAQSSLDVHSALSQWPLVSPQTQIFPAPQSPSLAQGLGL